MKVKVCAALCCAAQGMLGMLCCTALRGRVQAAGGASASPACRPHGSCFQCSRQPEARVLACLLVRGHVVTAPRHLIATICLPRLALPSILCHPQAMEFFAPRGEKVGAAHPDAWR